MASNLSDDELLRSYLLGELPEPEADRLERRLLEEDELFLLCEAVEADLLAACDRGELASAERERVLRRLASSPRGRERLALARSLNAAADRDVRASVVPFPRRGSAASPRPVARWAALAAAVLIVVTGASWFALQTLQERSAATRVTQKVSTPASRLPKRPAAPVRPAPPEVSAPTPETPQSEPVPAGPREERLAPTPLERPEPAVIVLSLATLRGEQPVEILRLLPDMEAAEIQIDLEGFEDLKSFSAAVRSLTGEPVWKKVGLEPRQLDWGPALVLEIPAERLRTGRYEVVVTSGEETLSQEFKVIQESR